MIHSNFQLLVSLEYILQENYFLFYRIMMKPATHPITTVWWLSLTALSATSKSLAPLGWWRWDALWWSISIVVVLKPVDNGWQLNRREAVDDDDKGSVSYSQYIDTHELEPIESINKRRSAKRGKTSVSFFSGEDDGDSKGGSEETTKASITGKRPRYKKRKMTKKRKN